MPQDFRHTYTGEKSIIQSKQKQQTNEPTKTQVYKGERITRSWWLLYAIPQLSVNRIKRNYCTLLRLSLLGKTKAGEAG